MRQSESVCSLYIAVEKRGLASILHFLTLSFHSFLLLWPSQGLFSF